MAVFETWMKSDLKKSVSVLQLAGNLFSADNGGNLIGVEILDGGEPADVSGSVYGYVIRADGQTVVIDGTLEDNRASIVLPASAYVVVGRVSIVIKVGTTTVGACTGYVYRTTTDAIVDPGSVVPDISELLAIIGDCEDAADDATAAAAAATSAAENALGNFAPAFAQATANAAGSFVTYTDGKMYYLPDGHTANTTWANTTKVLTNSGAELSNLKSAIPYKADNKYGGTESSTDLTFTNKKAWSSNGSLTTLASRAASDSIAKTPDMLSLVCASGYAMAIYGNNAGSGSAITTISTWESPVDISNLDYKYLFITIKKSDGSDFDTGTTENVVSIKKGTEIIPFLTKNDAVVPFGTRIESSNYSSILSDCNNAFPNVIYNIFGCADLISHTPSISSTDKTATLLTFVDNKASSNINWRVQFYIPSHSDTNGIYIRNAANSAWNSWINIKNMDGAFFANITRITTSNYSSALSDFNSALVNRIYNINGCADLISHSPYGGSQSKSGTLIVFNGETTTSNWTVQFYATKDDNGSVLFVRFCINNIFYAWKNLTSANNVYAEEMGYFVATCINKAVITGISSATNILAFGDSIVKGVGVEKAWLGYVEDATECTVVNKSVGGALFGESVKTSSYWISTQIAGVSNTEWDNATLVIVGAGTNDAGNDTPLSELKEKVQSAITAIKAKTDAPILFITPIRRGASNTDSNLLKLPMVSGIICNVAVSNGCSVLNGFDIPIPTYTIGQITDLTQDHLHPNDTGAKVYAMAFLNAVM